MNRFFMLLFFALLAAVPTAEGQWEKVNGPNGGNVLNLTSSGAGLFAQIISGSSGEVFISTDTGTNWNSFRLRSRVVQNVGGCGPYLFAWTQDTFYVSTNSGKTWIEDSNWIDSKHYYLNLFAQVGSNLYAAGGGIFQSSDGGLTWTALNSNLPNCYINGLTACNNNLYTLLAADSGLFRSTNNGKSWTEADRGLPYDTNVHGYTALHSIATIGTSLFVGTNSGVYRSTDSGNTWNKVNMVTPLNVWALTADGTKLYAATLSQGVFLSIDSGISWTQHGQGETLNEQYNYYNLITVVGSEIFVASADGIYRSNDTSGVGTLVGLPCLGISSFSANGNNLYADGFVSTDEGLNWSLNQNTLSSTSNLPNTLKYPFLVRMGKYLFVSTSRFAFGEADTDVFRSSDNGKTWYVDFEGLRPVVYGTLARLTGNRLIYAGSSDDNHFACFETDDFGISWNAVDSTSIFCCGNSNGPFLPKDICCPVPATAAQIGTVLIGIDSGMLFRSSDDGSTWGVLDSSIVNDSVTSAAALDNNLFACTKGGNLFVSADTGVSWKQINNGLIDSTISFVSVTGEFIFAANTNDSFWRRPLSDFGIAIVSNQLQPKEPLRTFPNPFSSNTQISFTAPESGYAEISIVNSFGAEVARIYSGELAAGNHSFAFDGSDLTPGNYWCVVRMNGQVQTLPLALLR